MTYSTFCMKLRRKGASWEDIHRLEKEGQQSAEGAHRPMYEAGEMANVKTERQFEEFCKFIGRDFVIENLDDLFSFERRTAWTF